VSELGKLSTKKRKSNKKPSKFYGKVKLWMQKNIYYRRQENRVYI
jgi:hypothetical protein